MTNVIITLIHTQEKNLTRVLESYVNQTIQPDSYIFVLDRCSDNSRKVLENFQKKYPVYILENNSGEGFLAGYCRDFGVNFVKTLYENFSILFLDGDCVPSEKIFEETFKVLNVENEMITIGRRISEKEDGIDFHDDPRILSPITKNKIFKEGFNNIVSDMHFARQRSITWSCCLGLNYSALNFIEYVVEIITEDRRIFSKAFDGTWGGEDDFIGLIAMFYDIPVVAIDPGHFIRHIYHDSRKNETFTSVLKNEYKKLRALAIKTNAPGIKFSEMDMVYYLWTLLMPSIL